MPENNQILSVEGQLIGMPTAGPESFSAEQLAYLKRALGVDETVLWEGTPTTSMTLSETPANFEYLRVYVTRDSGVQLVGLAAATSNYLTFGMLHYDNSEGSVMQEITAAYTSSNGTTFTLVKTARRWYNGTTVGGNVGISNSYITKIVGVNRKESA